MSKVGSVDSAMVGFIERVGVDEGVTERLGRNETVGVIDGEDDVVGLGLVGDELGAQDGVEDGTNVPDDG